MIAGGRYKKIAAPIDIGAAILTNPIKIFTNAVLLHRCWKAGSDGLHFFYFFADLVLDFCRQFGIVV